jgi:hypothetical protein
MARIEAGAARFHEAIDKLMRDFANILFENSWP